MGGLIGRTRRGPFVALISSTVVGLSGTLQSWLCDHAYPLWWTHGADRIHGGFHEKLQLDAIPSAASRRARLHPRQVCAFSAASELGWTGPQPDAVRHGLDYFLAHYRRPDRLIRALVAPDGKPLDDEALLYDQAFALLGFAAAYPVLDDESLRRQAYGLLDELHARFADGLGFKETTAQLPVRMSNSHMHLLEAALAWMQVDSDARWTKLANAIVALALGKLVDQRSGFIREYFDVHWQSLPNIEGDIVEPGHQFEWAWLLLRWHGLTGDEQIKETALRLIDQTELHGMDHDRGVAIASILSDGSVVDCVARLWPQTERIKAACLAATTTQDPKYSTMAIAASRGLAKYLDTPLRGLWRDQLAIDGSFIVEPAPASSFYHIVGAISVLRSSVCGAATPAVD